MLVASCSSTSKGGATSTTAANGSTTSEVLGDPVEGGSLTYGIEAETDDGWCLPESQLAASGFVVANSMFDSLFVMDQNYVPQPYLAESYSWNPDFTALTIKIRPNIKFSDGSPLTAEVVKLNLDVTYGDDAAVKKTKVSPLLFRFVYQEVAKVDVSGPLSVVVHTKRPWPALVSTLATGRNGILGEAQLMEQGVGADANPNANKKCPKNPIGTGPFRMVKWDPNVSMELERNPNYWRKDAKGRQLPYLDKLTFVPIPSNPQRYDALLGNSIQAGHWNNQVQFDEIAKNPKFHLVHDVEGHREVSFGMFNAASPALSDPEVRRHLIMGIDPKEVNKINSKGVWHEANGPFDTKAVGYLPDPGKPSYDPAAAKTFFAGKNLTFHLDYTTDPTTKSYVEEIKSELADIGVTVEIADKNQSAIVEQALGGKFDMMWFRLHPGIDPDTQYVFWSSKSPVDFGRIKDPEVDRLLDEGRTSSDPVARKKIYEDLNRALAKGSYDLWSWNTEWIVGSDVNVKNLTGATFPDNTTKTAGLNWGWQLLGEAWVAK